MILCRSLSLGVSSMLSGLVVCFSFALSLCSNPAWGQAVSTGTVVGQVLDPQNAAVPGATVTLIDKATNTLRATTTTDTGRFVFPDVPPAKYDLAVAKEGFSQTKILNQEVTVGQQLTLNVNLKVGAASETVVVTTTVGAQLQTMNATVGETVTGTSLVLLPNFGRDASTLATLQPATNPSGETAGANYDQNSYMLNGANNTNDMDGTMNLYTPSYSTSSAAATQNTNGSVPTGVMPAPVESIQEFRTNTNNQTADFVGGAGAQIMMVTKKGTDAFHGTAYEYYEDSTFGGANSWDNNAKGIPNPSSHYSRFGGNAGGPLGSKFMGGKWYLFGEYDGRRLPIVSTFEASVPTPTLRAGVVGVRTVQNGVNAIQYVNLNSSPVTVNGTTYPVSSFCGPTGTMQCDPLGLGINPVISQIWSTYMPLPNLTTGGDEINTLGYLSLIHEPETDNFGVIRLDHDFNSKWHWNAVYNYYHLYLATPSQVDIGGFFPGDTFGQAAAKSNRPQVPSLYSTELTWNATNNVTNDIHVSYLRDFWQWVDSGIPPQFSELGGVLEPGGETSSAQIPYNVNNQSTRLRFWDGQDKMVRDDITDLRGNHLLQFGGLYQRNYLQHQRDDNGNTIQSSRFPVYILNTPSSTAIDFTNSIPQQCGGSIQTSCIAAGTDVSGYESFFAEATGMITQTQDLYTRAGKQLTVAPLGTPSLAQSVVPTYNVYFTDTWHAKPTFTLMYGLGYQIEMPPYEINGEQITLVDQNDVPITVQQYLSETYQAGIKGQIYNPIIGFATVGNVAGNKASGGEKYPYNPFYKGLSPHISFAWNPNYDSGLGGKLFGHGKTVIRAGYSRIYGRLNGVDLILAPLLAPGFLQSVVCQGPIGYGPSAGTCGGATTADAFRVGPTSSGFSGFTAPLPSVSTNLPQPFFPGVNGQPSAGSGIALDPNFQPNHSDEVDLTIQRELPGKWIMEVGYIGRRLRNEYQPIDISAVPTMLTLGGQSFAQAWGALYTEVNNGQPVAAQPWFESALGGASSPYCSGFSSCTAAVAAKETFNINQSYGNAPAVYDMWQDLSPNFTFGRSMPSSPNCVNQLVPSISSTASVPVCQQMNGIEISAALGWGNYNGLFASLTSADWHGLTARSNFTWGRSLGTQSVPQAFSAFTVSDPWDLHNGYGPQPFDIKFIYNLTMVYRPTWYKGQHGWKGQLLGGWDFAPLFSARSGQPLEVNIVQGAGEDCQSFGEADCNFFSSDEGAVFASASGVNTARGAGNSLHAVTVTGLVGSNGNTANGGYGLNMYADPAAVYNSFRAPVIGIDTNPGSFALRGFPTWNLDFTLAKDFNLTERLELRLSVQITNIFNHVQYADPFDAINDPADFGAIYASTSLPRAMEFGLRIHF